MLAAPPAGARPSVELADRYALFALNAALRGSPGMLRNVPLTCNSTFGMMYTPNVLNCVSHGVSRWQNCSGLQAVGVPVGTMTAALPTLAKFTFSISGTF